MQGNHPDRRRAPQWARRLRAGVVLLLSAGAAALRSLWHGGSPRLAGALSMRERSAIHRRLRQHLGRAERDATPFRLTDVLAFRFTRVAVLGPCEDIRALFPATPDAIVRVLAQRERSVVVIERAPGRLVFIIFGPADAIPFARPVCLEASEVTVTPTLQHGLPHLAFTAAPDDTRR
jgi:hypothetical protein